MDQGIWDPVVRVSCQLLGFIKAISLRPGACTRRCTGLPSRAYTMVIIVANISISSLVVAVEVLSIYSQVAGVEALSNISRQ